MAEDLGLLAMKMAPFSGPNISPENQKAIAQVYGGELRNDALTQAANNYASGQVIGAEATGEAHVQGADLGRLATQYGADRSLEGQKYTSNNNLVAAGPEMNYMNQKTADLQDAATQAEAQRNKGSFQQQAYAALGVKNLDELKQDPQKFALFGQYYDLAGEVGPQAALTKMQDTMNYSRWDKQFNSDNVNTVRSKEGLTPLAPAQSSIFDAPAPGDAQAAANRQSLVRQYGPYFDKHINQNGVLGTLQNILPKFGE